MPGSENFKDFIVEFSQLKQDFKSLINSHYSFDIFVSTFTFEERSMVVCSNCCVCVFELCVFSCYAMLYHMQRCFQMLRINAIGTNYSQQDIHGQLKLIP